MTVAVLGNDGPRVKVNRCSSALRRDTDYLPKKLFASLGDLSNAISVTAPSEGFLVVPPLPLQDFQCSAYISAYCIDYATSVQIPRLCKLAIFTP